RIDCSAEKVSREESTRYFHSRPVGSQLGAWVSHQSEVIDARRMLEARLSELEERFAGQEIPCPPHWGGYRVKPERIEFWQGRPNRLHDRLRYARDGRPWRIKCISPYAAVGAFQRRDRSAAGTASEAWEQTKEKAGAMKIRTEIFVRRNPIPILLGALGIGIGIGLAIRYASTTDTKEDEPREKISDG